MVVENEIHRISKLGLAHCIFNHLDEVYSTLSAIRLFRRFCKQFSESSPCLPGQQRSCIIFVELSENILQNLGNDLMANSVVSFYVQ